MPPLASIPFSPQNIEMIPNGLVLLMLQFVAIADESDRREGCQLERSVLLSFVPEQEVRDRLRILFDGARGMVMLL